MGLLEEHFEDISAALWALVQTQYAGVPRNLADPEDLHQAALLAVVIAAERFDPTRGAKFTTWAVLKGGHAIIDALRAADWLPRSARLRAREIEEARTKLEAALERAPSDAEIAAAMGMRLKTYQKSIERLTNNTVVSLDVERALPDSSGDEVSLHNMIEDPTAAEAFDAVEADERAHLVADAMERLPERERMVVALYYYEDMNQREIAELLGVSESRICQLRGKADARLAANRALADV